jgi:hypothetical protein
MLLGKIHITPKGFSMFTNKKAKIKGNYVSEIDQFLQVLNNLPGAISNARIAEEHKYQRIFSLRDTPQLPVTAESAWIDI